MDLDSTVNCQPGVLGPTDLLNRPGSANKPNPIFESLHLLQKGDTDSLKMGLKTIRDLLRENSSIFDDKLINRVTTLKRCFSNVKLSLLCNWWKLLKTVITRQKTDLPPLIVFAIWQRTKDRLLLPKALKIL